MLIEAGWSWAWLAGLLFSLSLFFLMLIDALTERKKRGGVKYQLFFLSSAQFFALQRSWMLITSLQLFCLFFHRVASVIARRPATWKPMWSGSTGSVIWWLQKSAWWATSAEPGPLERRRSDDTAATADYFHLNLGANCWSPVASDRRLKTEILQGYKRLIYNF